MIDDIIFFVLRYTPFWAVPVLMISFQFGYIYWMKGIRWVSYVMWALFGFSGLVLLFYIYEGSPSKAAGGYDFFMRSLLNL